MTVSHLDESRAAEIAASELESVLAPGREADALGPEAREFHLQLRRRPVKTSVHLRRLLNLIQLYGRADVLAAIVLAHQYQTYDAAYVEALMHHGEAVVIEGKSYRLKDQLPD